MFWSFASQLIIIFFVWSPGALSFIWQSNESMYQCIYVAEDRLFTFCRYICYLFCYYPGYYWLLWKTSVCFVLTGGTGATLDNAIKRRIKSVSQMGWFLCLLHSRPTRESLCLYEVGRRKFLSKILQIKKMSSHQTEISNWNHLLNVKHFLLCLTLYIS